MAPHSAQSDRRVSTGRARRRFGTGGAATAPPAAMGPRRLRGLERRRRRRRRRRRMALAVLFCAVLAVVALLVWPSSKNVPKPAARTSGTAGNTKTLLIDLDGTNYNWSEVAPTYQAVVLNDWEASWIPKIKAQSPSTRVFVYKDLSSTRSDDCTGNPDGTDSCISNGVFCPPGINDSPTLAAGVGFCWAGRNDPDWFLRDASGAPITEVGYPTQYMMDFGNPAYQAKWLANVKADVLSNGWQGVLMDNVLDNTNYGTPASYPTPAAIQAAMLSMLKVVGPGLKAAGITDIGNLGYNNLYPTLWSTWLAYVSGLVDEFTYYWPGNAPEGAKDWASFLEPEVRSCASQRKVCVFNIGNGTLTQPEINFANASILLYSNGSSYVSYGDGNSDQDPHVTLGAATGSACESHGIWRRDFTGGSVSVNPLGQTGDIGDDVTGCSS